MSALVTDPNLAVHSEKLMGLVYQTGNKPSENQHTHTLVLAQKGKQSLIKSCFLLTYCLFYITTWELEFLFFICATMLSDVSEMDLQKKNHLQNWAQFVESEDILHW